MSKHTPAQIEQAFDCVRIVVEAYALACENNGGSASIDWETIDMAHEQGISALSDEENERIVNWAREYNAALETKGETK